MGCGGVCVHACACLCACVCVREGGEEDQAQVGRLLVGCAVFCWGVQHQRCLSSMRDLNGKRVEREKGLALHTSAHHG